jgi:hypothetical protein
LPNVPRIDARPRLALAPPANPSFAVAERVMRISHPVMTHKRTGFQNSPFRTERSRFGRSMPRCTDRKHAQFARSTTENFAVHNARHGGGDFCACNQSLGWVMFGTHVRSAWILPATTIFAFRSGESVC